MPYFSGIHVHVENIRGHKFDEWGVQSLPRQNKISAYITSKSEEIFQIVIKPDLLRPLQPRSRPLNRPSSSIISPEDTRNEEHSSNTKENPSSPINDRRTKSHGIIPPFHLLASLYLDGRQTPERRAVVYLDPIHKDFSRPDGEIRLKNSIVLAEDGSVRQAVWIFKDIGIETVFDKLFIAKRQNQVDGGSQLDEANLVAAMDASELGCQDNIKREEKNRLGQIVVVFERVVLGRMYYDRNFRPWHDVDVNMDDSGSNITHITQLIYDHNTILGPFRRVPCDRIEEGPYATFQFFYRNQGKNSSSSPPAILMGSAEALEKFNFPGYPKSPKNHVPNRVQMERKMVDMTPLSIAHPVQSWKPPTKTFEQSIKDESFDPKKENPRFFDQPCQKVVAVKERIPNLKREGLRVDALHELAKVPELISRKSSKSKLLTHKSIHQPGFSTAEAALALSSNKSASSIGVRANTKNLPSSFVAIDTNSGIHPCMTTSKSVFNTESTLPRPSAENNFKESDKLSDSSDADDERDASGSETVEDSQKDLSSERDSVASRDRDDGGLHVKFEEVTIGKKRCIDNDDDDGHGYHNGERGETAGSILETEAPFKRTKKSKCFDPRAADLDG